MPNTQLTPSPPPPTLFAFGLGFSALALAKQLLAEGWRVRGTCRDLDKTARLRRMGIDPVVFDSARGPMADAARELDSATHVLVSTPPDDAGDPVLRHHAALLAGLPLRWLGYLSTTGVYGDHGGAWVDETSETRPGPGRSQRRLEAERNWLALRQEHGLPVHIFRLAGIYGPGRSAIDQVRAGRARRVVKPGHLFGRIHVADIAGVLRASIDRPAPGAIYNLSDDEPASGGDVTAHACALLGVPPPPEVPFDEAELSPMARSFYADNRRVRNDKIKRELGYILRYPTYREGLRAVLANHGQSTSPLE